MCHITHSEAKVSDLLSTALCRPVPPAITFTAEEIAKFEKRYEEGYDIIEDPPG